MKETFRSAFDIVSRLPKVNLPSPRTVLQFALGTSQIQFLNDQPIRQEAKVTDFQSCPNPPQLSCKVDFISQDRCCFNYPGGQLLLTQFWDADPPTGPAEEWTIHGLWPDHCDGSYDQFCDANRRFNNISSIIEESGRVELLALMKTYWKDFRGDDENLWEHEWNKHGTCVSTLEPKCYPDYVPQQEVVSYFQKTVNLFLGLPSYDILSAAGIHPSDTETYELDAIEKALKTVHGVDVVVRCRNGALNELFYHYNIAGPFESGRFVPAAPDSFFLESSKGLCAFNGDDGFVCDADVDEPTAFTSLDDKLSLNDKTVFYADSVPKRQVQGSIYESQGQHLLPLEIYWREV
ncbi:hypothetical protein GX48_07307 [Paracoccidioides brasiliensis]|nr:hypothetical protein GX48_07307 [Paracoccidioides brasiliensis]